MPACELGCGNGAADPDFPFVELGADPTLPSPPGVPPAHPAPPDAPPPGSDQPPGPPSAPPSPRTPPPPYTGRVSVAASLRAATYKACYAYREDLQVRSP